MSRAMRSLTPIFVLIAAPAAFAAGPGSGAAPQELYATTCAPCHESGVGPAILGRELAEEYVASVVRHGQRAMPAFFPSEFTDAELGQLARWVGDPKAVVAIKGRQP